MTDYYRVDLNKGVVIEKHPTGLLEGFGIIGKTAFRQMDSAKRAFDEATKAEIKRLRELRKKIRPINHKDGFEVIDNTPPLLKLMEGNSAAQ